MKVYVGITDMDWYRTLAASPEIREVNFWKPGGGVGFQALASGEPFLFKTHWPHNRIVGGGYFEGFAQLPLSSAWEFFGRGNGVADLDQMRVRLGKYRREEIRRGDDPIIGCVLLNEVSSLMNVSLSLRRRTSPKASLKARLIRPRSRILCRSLTCW